MQRKFFHNQHDQVSRETLATLDTDIQVMDVYALDAAGQREILDRYEIHRMPYLINREIVMLSSAEQTAGTFILDFEIRDWQGNLVTEHVDVHIFLSVSGVERHENIETDTGTFSLELTCSTEQEIGLRITDYKADDGIDIFDITIKVVAPV